MSKSNLQNSFKGFCKDKKFEINDQQLKILVSLEKFLYPQKNFFSSFF